ncbi:MAG: hypothetical protein AAF961_17395, partial [Planctomycetota bacterium]
MLRTLLAGLIALNCLSHLPWGASLARADHEASKNCDLSPADARRIVVTARLVEINRTAMRRLGVDFASVNEGKAMPRVNGERGTGMPTTPSDEFIHGLCANGLAKVLAERTVVTTEGRAALVGAGSREVASASAKRSAADAEKQVGARLRVEPRRVGEDLIRVAYQFEFHGANHYVFRSESLITAR